MNAPLPTDTVLSEHATDMPDVLVLGGGNAALCAALAAREAGARRVLVLEHAPRAERGGNSRHTRNLRCMHQQPADVLTGRYPESEYWDDLQRVTGGATDERLARMTIRASAEVRDWMRKQGVRFQPSLSGTLSLGRTNAFFRGGGKALLNAYYLSAERLGVEISYDTEVLDLEIEDGRFHAARVRRRGFPERIEARTLIAAAGGFESNLEWLEEAWGPAARNFLIRGTTFNRGAVLRTLLARGARRVGEPDQCHAVAIDARAPRYDGGIVTRLDCVPFSIVVNREGRRFYDEGEDFWPKRYAIWGRLVARQPEQTAYALIDAKMTGDFMPSLFPPIRGDSLRELAGKLDLDAAVLERTVADYNAAVRPGRFDAGALDDCATEGLDPPKTHWARPLDTPPFHAYPLRPGITFTYLGVGVDERARLLMDDGRPSANIFAAGEIMAGNILGRGYLAGIGMTIGTVFGRIAGQEAARHAAS
ncbi:MAG: FAD-dependent tricarballylate dehydrogenase TcuA [Acidihalobacter sp.]